MSKKENKTNTSINLNDDNIVIHRNLDQEIILISIDKLKLILRDHQDSLHKKDDWKSSGALFITLLITNLTSTFDSTWGLTSDTWKAIFVILCLGALLWFVNSIVNAFKNKRFSIDTIIENAKVAHDK